MSSQARISESSVAWRPQPGPQTMLLSCPVRDILFGGQRGGGKSDGALGHIGKHAAEHGKHAKGLYIRPTYSELEEVIDRGRQVFGHVAQWKEGKHIFEFGNGARLKMRFIEKPQDADRHLGHQNTHITVEEAGVYPSPQPLDRLRATLRSAAGVPTWFTMNCNPGGAGHNWIKRRYIDPSPPMVPFTDTMKIGGMKVDVRRVFIPSKLADNKILMANDPDYMHRVIEACAGQDWLVKAWLEGDWNIVAGGALDDIWDESVHVVGTFKIPNDWPIHRSLDWGFSKPFSVGWWVRATGEELWVSGHGPWTPYAGSHIRIGEYYGCKADQPNVGMSLEPDTVAKNILEYEADRGWTGRISGGVADGAIFSSDHGRSVADIMLDAGVGWEAADKKPGSRKAGFLEFRMLLRAAHAKHPESPGLYVTDACRAFISTVPILPRGKDMDDVDTNAEDHIYDEARYFVNWTPETITEGRLGGL